MTITFHYGPFEVQADISSGFEGDSSIPNGTHELYDVDVVRVDHEGEDLVDYISMRTLEGIESRAIKEYQRGIW